MKTPILNRQFQHPADGWYQIETPGEHANDKAGVVQVIDSKAVAFVVSRFNQEADDYQRRTGEPFPGMLIDIEHFKHDADKETRAYGWLMRLENRGGVPYGQINWTGTGKPAVDGGDYRFFSTEYDPKDLEVLNSGTPRRVRPLRLDGLTLTNDPNNKGGAPITNRFGNFDSEADYEEARKANQAQVAKNISDAKKAAAEREAYSRGEEAELSLPALEKWFRAVKSIQDTAGKHGGVKMSFTSAWELAKQKFPAIYNDAFDIGEGATGSDDEAVARAASNRVGMLANRVKLASGGSFHQGWEFVREMLPRIFNRQFTKAQLVLNRTPNISDGPALMNWASKVFARMAQAEKVSTRSSLDQAWTSVGHAHPGLKGLASGSMTMDQACAIEPDLMSLI